MNPFRRTLLFGVIAAGLAGALLDSRLAHGQDDAVPVRLERIADGLTAPVFVTQPAEGDELFVVDQPGQVRVVRDGVTLETPFLDLSDRIVELQDGYDERGLLGLAFHPEYAENGRFFVYYSAPLRDGAPEGWDHTSHLAEFRVSDDDPLRADPASERIVMRVDQPFVNHNAGHIIFGDDGLLYVPLGDGGNGGDIDPPDDDRGRPEGGNAQTRSTLLGSVLRIDVDGDAPYGIPADNPFANGGGRPEIWAYGLRNPYGLSKDIETGDLYAADAGQALFEEVNLLEAGANFGWNTLEAESCFNPDDFTQPLPDCPQAGDDGVAFTDPVAVYRRGPQTGSVGVGGVMYRGDAVPALRDRLVFADYARIRYIPEGILYVAEPREERPWPVRRIRVDNPLEGVPAGEVNRFVLGVGQDREGELYILTTAQGGPAGTTGEIFAVRDAGAAGDDEGGIGTRWWIAIVGAAVVALLGTIAGLAGRRSGRTGNPRGPTT